MINRTLIRGKVVQLTYAYYQKGGNNIDAAEKELLDSLAASHELYHYLLTLMTAVTRLAAEQLEQQEELNRVTHKTEILSHRFIDNRFILQLDANKQLADFRERHHLWAEESTYVKALYDDIIQSEYYKEYMEAEDATYVDDREVWRKIYKNIIMKDERIDDLLEEHSLYWNDDKETVDTFVLKTIKRFTEDSRSDGDELLPEFKDDEDREFAMRLLRRTILNADYYRSLISRNVQNWEFDRLAFMDVIIMQIAIAEILSFPQIPISVSINEYVEIAKLYSTPKSYGYVNGILDAVIRGLKEEGKLLKE